MKKNLNQYFDHTVLKAEAGEADILKLCREAREFEFYGVCVNSCHVPLVKRELAGSPVKIVAVVGFPLGACASQVKTFEAEWACANGADEIDMVLPVGALKERRLDYVLADIRAVTHAAGGAGRNEGLGGDEAGRNEGLGGDEAGRNGDLGGGAAVKSRRAGEGGIIVKVILETCLLTDEEIVTACHLAEEAGADFVKTSTGFSSGGASARHVELMKSAVGDRLQVKASGGIRTLGKVLEMIEAGADRIGASASVDIMKEGERKRGQGAG